VKSNVARDITHPSPDSRPNWRLYIKDRKATSMYHWIGLREYKLAAIEPLPGERVAAR